MEYAAVSVVGFNESRTRAMVYVRPPNEWEYLFNGGAGAPVGSGTPIYRMLGMDHLGICADCRTSGGCAWLQNQVSPASARHETPPDQMFPDASAAEHLASMYVRASVKSDAVRDCAAGWWVPDRGDTVDQLSYNRLPPLSVADDYVLFLTRQPDDALTIHFAAKGAFRLQNWRVEPLGGRSGRRVEVLLRAAGGPV